MPQNKSHLIAFQKTVWDYYHAHKRFMPWRESHDLYSVLVSELMLQQTQVSRVITKFESFMERFPTIESLARAPLGDVIIAWQGLGYNRRAKYLHQAAIRIMELGVPTTIEELEQLPGVGRNTAAAIMAYVHNQPAMFIETNIRTVYIHEFFSDHDEVSDTEILKLVEKTCDTSNPREWFWALMDYGTYLKSQKLGSIRKSAQYKRQSVFKGSLREMRGNIIRTLGDGPKDIQQIEHYSDERFLTALEGLIRDGLVEQHESVICLTAHNQQS
jgi:A/G-specific adenine glycosylase